MPPEDLNQSVMTALRGRRSIPRLTDSRPPRAIVEQVIQAATWAPNHHKTEPWRFAVVAGDARMELGAVMAASLEERLDGQVVDREVLLAKERAKPLRAPIVVAVAALPSDGPKVIEEEELAAVAAGVQNMLLAAEALGLGAMWRTGKPAYDPAVKRYLGFPERAHLVAFVYLGYPDLPDLPERTRDAAQFTRWLGWDDHAGE